MSRPFNSAVTDPHEDRWNRLTTGNRKQDINSDAEVDDVIDAYMARSNWNIDGGRRSAQEQALNQLARHENQLQAYRDKVNRHFDDIKSSKYMPNSHLRFPISNSGLPAGPAVLNSDHLPATIHAYDEKVRSLESEMDNRERDVVKMSEIIKVLMNENNYLKDHIASKNKDMQKTLETVALQDAEVVHDLKHRLNLLGEENNILIDQLDKLKAAHENTTRNLKKKEDELDKLVHDYAACKDNFGSSLAREGALTNQNQSSEIKNQKAQEKIRQLEAHLEDTKRELEQLKNKHHAALDNLDVSKRDMKEIDERSKQEASQIVQQNTKLQNQIAELKKQLDEKTKNLGEAERELRKAHRDLDAYKLENEEYVQRLHSYKNELAISPQREGKKEKKHDDEHVKEIKKLKKTIKTIEEHAKIAKEDAERSHKKDIRKQEKMTDKVRKELEEVIDDKDNHISYLNHQVDLLKRELENVSGRPVDLGHYESIPKRDNLFPVSNIASEPRLSHLRDYTPPRDYASVNQATRTPVRDNDKLRELSEGIAKDIDTAQKKLRSSSPGLTAHTTLSPRNYSPDHTRGYSNPGLLNPFTSSASSGNLMGSRNRRHPSHDRGLYETPESLRRKEHYPQSEVQKIVDDILNKDDGYGRGRSAERERVDGLKSNLKSNGKYTSPDAYSGHRLTPGLGRHINLNA